jgi:hypothetical protein
MKTDRMILYVWYKRGGDFQRYDAMYTPSLFGELKRMKVWRVRDEYGKHLIFRGELVEK